MTRFKEILDTIGADRRYNLHSHTQFCDGHADMETMVRGAVDAGLRYYGFSPHGPIDIPSPCNMRLADVAAYAAEAERLRQKYAGDIALFTGMEVDYLAPGQGPASPAVRDYGLDYVIGSVHFVPAPDGTFADTDGPAERFRTYVNDIFGGDLRYVVDTFFAQTRDMVREGGLDIIGHFDKIAQNASTMEPDIESQAWFGRQLDDTIDCILASGVAVEINTKARARHGRFFPHTRLWQRLKQAGVTILVNSDAHDPALTDASRGEAFGILDSLK